MKTAIKILLIIPLIFALLGCEPKPPDLEDRITDNQEDVKSYIGVIESFEIDIYQDGTHQIRTEEDEVIIIQSPTINLNNYLDKKVIITGSMQKLIDNKSEVFTVEEIKLEEADENGEVVEYENPRFGFRFKYPNLWELFEDTNGLTFRGNGINWVTIDIFNTDTELDEFVASHEIEDGTPVTIGGQRSLRYIESKEIRIYIPNSSKEKIYRITFYNEEEDEVQNELFYSFLESFSLIISKIKEGEKCGGEENLTCGEGFRCELESGEENAEGICVAVDDVDIDLNCPYVSTPPDCLEYKAKSFNKEGCPTSYVCLDDGEPENSAEEPEEETSSSQSSVIDDLLSTFIKYQDKILSSGAEILQFEIVEEQNLLAVIYLLEDQKYRTLFSYEPVSNEFSFIRKAHFEEGEERDWVIVEGEDIRIKYDRKIIKVGGSQSNIQIIREDMRLYENSHKDFSMQYPKDWYYRSFGAIGDTIWAVGFADESLDYFSDAIISVVILEGEGEGRKEMKGDHYTVEVNRDEDSHFFLKGPLEMKDTIDAMAKTILQN